MKLSNLSKDYIIYVFTTLTQKWCDTTDKKIHF
jgi:hypothetical protein